MNALLTDLYQLTMACGYWKSGIAEREAVFHLFFRNQPFRSGYAIAGGLAPAIDILKSLRFEEDDLLYLASLRGANGMALFPRDFLDSLRDFHFRCDVDAIPEGTAVFAHEPLLRVRGPLLQAQLVETMLLNIINFQTLIATKAARIVEAAEGRSVLEFGLRRAQGPDGGLGATRAAFLGGCEATSNVLAGHAFGIPVRGTHAHSWVMAFESEPEAFEAWAGSMPQSALFLVDTYDTLQGVRNAIETAARLREQGMPFLGIRLDSGDLAWLSIEARRMLDDAGFPDAQIVATNDLDEETITSLLQQGARIDVFGVGTRLVTAWDQPALGGVYKLGAIRENNGAWQQTLKLSEHAIKTSIPGILNVRRYSTNGRFRADQLWDELDGPPQSARITDPGDATRTKSVTADEMRDLLVPVFRGGSPVYDVPPLRESQRRTRRELDALDPAIRRLRSPHEYPVGLEDRLQHRRAAMIEEARSAR